MIEIKKIGFSIYCRCCYWPGVKGGRKKARRTIKLQFVLQYNNNKQTNHKTKRTDKNKSLH